MAKVLLIASYAPSLVNFRGDLIRALIARGHDVVTCAPPGAPDVAARLADWGADHRVFPLERTGLNPLADRRTRRALTSLVRTVGPTHVLSYTIKPVIYGSLAADKAGVPHVFAMITGLGTAFETRGPAGWALRCVAERFYRHALGRCEGVFFQNNDDRDLFVGRRLVSGTKTHRISGSGVHLARYPQRPVPTGPMRFLLIARLLADKGVREFAAAARSVKASHPEAAFVLTGFHEDHPRGISAPEVRRWQDAGWLTFTGPLQDVRPELAACTVYCLPSYREGLPRTVLEAMATGRAIITTDTPGCRETVPDGKNGILVPPRDGAALARAMIRYCEDPGLAAEHGRSSREIAAERFDVARVNETILAAMSL